MKVFISWSGQLTGAIADELRKWLPQVIQSLEVWVSRSDIEKGAAWQTVLDRELRTTNQGIVLITRANQSSQWLNYEAGALNKLASEEDAESLTRVRTVRVDLPNQDVTGPLGALNHTDLFDKEDMFRLIESLNQALEAPLVKEILRNSFDKFWDDLESILNELKTNPEMWDTSIAEKRSSEDLLSEVLNRIRSVERAASSWSAEAAVAVTRSQIRDAFYESRARLRHEAMSAAAQWPELGEPAITDEEQERRRRTAVSKVAHEIGSDVTEFQAIFPGSSVQRLDDGVLITGLLESELPDEVLSRWRESAATYGLRLEFRT